MVEAKLNREYALRMIGVGAMLVFIGLWSIYDGTTAWPKVNADLARVRSELLSTNLTAEAWIERQEDGTTQLGGYFLKAGLKMPSKLVKKLSELRLPEARAKDTVAVDQQQRMVRMLFEKPIYSEHDLRTQWIQAGLALGLSILPFLAVLFKVRRRFCADDVGLSGSGFGGHLILYTEIEAIDWGKWEDKGIAVLRLKAGGTIILDGWHFSGMVSVVNTIKAHRPDLAPQKESTPA